MVNQQKGVQQDAAYSAVVVNGLPVPISFLTHRNIKKWTGIHIIINCTTGSILLHSFLLIYHPYPSSFHEMIFILVYIHNTMLS